MTLIDQAFSEVQRSTRQLPRPRYVGDPELDEDAIAIAPWRPFPTSVLPATLADFIRETAAALGCDSAMIALPCLAALASCVGTTRVIELKRSWHEPCILWICVIARSGTLKSPALDAALDPFRRVQHEAMELYRRERDEYERAKARGDKGICAPACTRHIAGDVTVEALAPILAANPRGVLLARDELSGWLRGFNQYKARGRGGDESSWLEAHRGGPWSIDRKSQDGPTYVRRAAVSICGTCQPGVMEMALSDQLWENGLAARLLLAQPPETLKRWSDLAPPQHVKSAYEALIRTLLTLTPDADGDPLPLTLTPDALTVWRRWYDAHATRQADAIDDRTAASLAKIEGAAARFALIFELCADPDATTVGADAIRRGTALADWFANEQSRIYALIGGDAEGRDLAHLITWIQARGSSVTVRDLTHGLRRFRAKADEAKGALDELAKGGYGRWTIPTPDPAGGRPRGCFELLTPVTVTKTPRQGCEIGGFGDGDSGDRLTTAPIARSDDAPPLALVGIDESAEGEPAEIAEPW